MDRRLATFLSADVAGYSGLIERDELGTVARLRADLSEVFEPVIERHAGRIVNTAGDGVLAEFASVVNATQCAIDIQQAMAARNASRPDGERIDFRVGVNVGDIVSQGDDLYGDGINISARLQALAEPGGILASEEVAHHVEGKVSAALEFVGTRTVKNIERPVRVWRVLPSGGNRNAAPGSSIRRPRPERRTTAVGAILLLAVACFGLFAWYASTRETADTARQSVGPTEGGTPSIAVLPFENLSDDPGQAYLSDGISEDLITELSRLSNLIVLARDSSFAYKGQSVAPQTMGRELDVGYLLAGSVRRAGERLRITARLVETDSGRQLWAERYDRDLQDVFALQDEISRRIVAALQVRLEGDEGTRLGRHGTDSFAAYDAFLRGRQHFSSQSQNGLSMAAAAYREAIALDPDFGRAYGALAVMLGWEVVRGWSNSPSETLDRALQLAQRAVSTAPNSQQTFWALGWVYLQKRQFEDALSAAQQSIRIAPNYADGYGLLALINNNLGRAREAKRYIERGMALNPHYSWDYPYNLGRAEYILGDYASALDNLKKALARSEVNPFPRIYLIASYVRADQLAEAEWEAMQLDVLTPEFTLSHIAKALPLGDAAMRMQLEADLRTAGVRE